MPENLTAVWQTGAAAAVAFAVLALAYSYAKYERLMRLARSGGGGGLTPRDALLLAIARRLAIGSANRGIFAVLVVRLAPQPGASPSSVVLPILKGAARRTDDVMSLDAQHVGAILGLDPSHIGRVIERWRNGLASSASHPASAFARVCHFGVAFYPADGETGPGLLEAAGKALDAAVGRAPGLLVGDLPGSSTPEPEEPVSPAEAAMLDPLTGILRPEKMGGASRKFIARCRRDGLAVSVMHIDIDRLADINRRVGRDAGDAVLRAFGGLLSAHIREADLIGRLADDEFLAVLECSPADAQIAATRIVDRVRESVVTVGSARMPFAVCIGIAGIGGTGSTPGHVIDAAGTALQLAKRRGPNTWVVYDRSMVLHVEPEPGEADVL
jgi:diguanylate cyclase (GGDEF)-like protein